MHWTTSLKKTEPWTCSLSQLYLRSVFNFLQELVLIQLTGFLSVSRAGSAKNTVGRGSLHRILHQGLHSFKTLFRIRDHSSLTLHKSIFVQMDPAALAALPTEKAFKMELKRGQVPSANTKIYILPKFKHMPIFIIVDRLSSTMPSSYITAIPTNRRTNEDVPLLRGKSFKITLSHHYNNDSCNFQVHPRLR